MVRCFRITARFGAAPAAATEDLQGDPFMQRSNGTALPRGNPSGHPSDARMPRCAVLPRGVRTIRAPAGPVERCHGHAEQPSETGRQFRATRMWAAAVSKALHREPLRTTESHRESSWISPASPSPADVSALWLSLCALWPSV